MIIHLIALLLIQRELLNFPILILQQLLQTILMILITHLHSQIKQKSIQMVPQRSLQLKQSILNLELRSPIVVHLIQLSFIDFVLILLLTFLPPLIIRFHFLLFNYLHLLQLNFTHLFILNLNLNLRIEIMLNYCFVQ